MLDLDVLSRAGSAECRVDAEPTVRWDVCLDPGVRGRRPGDAAEIAAHVAGGQARVPAERDQHVREVLADTAPALEHLGNGAVHVRRSDPVLEPVADSGGGAAEECERAPARILVAQRRGEPGRVVTEGDVDARAEELGELVGQSNVRGKLPKARRCVRLALPRPPERLVCTRVRDDVARRLDHEAVVQVGDAEVVHGVAVVVAVGDHRCRRLDQEVEVEQRLRRARERLQPDLVEALEHLARVRVARPVPNPISHAIASCAVSGRWAKNSSSTRSPTR